MIEQVLAIEVGAPAGEILRYFAEYPVHHLPVVDKNRVVVGMVSSADVLKLEAFLPKHGDPADYLNRRMHVDQIMRQPPITIGPHASVEQAASLMAKHGVHALPVVTSVEGHLLGIITSTDIISAALGSGRHSEPSGDTDSETVHLQAHVSPSQMRRALSLASNLAGANSEQGELARALLSLNTQLGPLQAVLTRAARYVRAGQDERLHATLLRAIEKAEELPNTSAAALPL